MIRLETSYAGTRRQLLCDACGAAIDVQELRQLPVGRDPRATADACSDACVAELGRRHGVAVRP